MADILMASFPLAGHTLPLRPIARELHARGHHVRWYAGRRFATAVTETGAEFLPMPHGPADDGIPLDEAYPERAGLTGLDSIRWDMKNLFIGPAIEQVRQLRGFLAQRTADVVVCDAGFNGARFLGEADGVPWVTVGVSPLVLSSRDVPPFGLGLQPMGSVLGRARDAVLAALVRRSLRDVAAYLDAARAVVGLEPWTGSLADSFCSPYLHLQGGVPSLEYPRRDLPAQVYFVGALVDRAGDVKEPEWWSELAGSERPIVHVTQGTFANDDIDRLLLPTIRALAGEDVTVVATLGSSSASYSGALPANARVAPYLPYDKLLPITAAMVTNGGFGGVQHALAHGVPLVVAGAGEDKPEVAARVAWSGVGIDLRTDRPREDAIRAAVRSALDDTRYRAAAARVGAEFGRRDAGATSADLIERLVWSRP